MNLGGPRNAHDLRLGFVDPDGATYRVTLREKPTYDSSDPVQYALEANAGWFEKHGIKEGDIVELSADILEAGRRN